MPGKKTKSSQYFPYVLLGFLIIVILLVIFNISSIKRLMNDWKLLPEPERLTELYFTRPNNLPVSYSPGTNQDVSFTVHNLEYRTTNYKYQIIEQADNSSKSQLLASGSFSLKQNQYEKPSVDVLPIGLGSRVQIEVKLSNVNEQIDYRVNKA